MNQIPNIEEVVEKFAELEHERWSKWQSWLHSQCFRNPEFTGALIIPADLVARWERQIATPYAELSEKEKESDRKQVYPYIEHFATLHQQLQKAREEERERIRKVVSDLLPIMWSDDAERHASNIRLTNNLNIILKALDHSELNQPNK